MALTKQEIIEYVEDLGFNADMLDLYEDVNGAIFIVSRGSIPMNVEWDDVKLIGHIMRGKVTYYE